jgi:hypothetical protein
VPVELVSLDEVQALITQFDAEISELEERAAQATSAAEQCEARASLLDLSGQNRTWAMASLQRFLAEWEQEVGAEARSIVEGARSGARLRIDEAHAEAARLRRAYGEQPFLRPLDAFAEPDVPKPDSVEPVELPGTTPAIAVEPAASAVEVPAVSLVVSPEAPAPTPAMAESPATEGSSGVTMVMPLPEHPNGSAPADSDEDVIFGMAAPAVPVPTPVERPAESQEEPEASSPDRQDDFWPATQAPRRKSLFRRIPVSAVLEVLAVVLVLVFILLRLS